MTENAPIPRFRGKSYKMGDGTVHTYYVWDGRGRGMGEVRLGKDRDRALAVWAECERGVFPSQETPTRSRPMKVMQPRKRRVIEGAAWLKAEPWVRTMYFNAERRATQIRKPFMLTPAEMLEVVAAANGACQISGILFEQTKSKSPFAPSLDRIDCSKGYTKENVRLVCHVANVAMNNWGIEPVLRLAKAINAPTTIAGCA